jgi:hypothetical protein
MLSDLGGQPALVSQGYGEHQRLKLSEVPLKDLSEVLI